MFTLLVVKLKLIKDDWLTSLVLNLYLMSITKTKTNFTIAHRCDDASVRKGI